MEESVVWQFFEKCADDESFAQCLKCGQKYCRGKTAKSYSTKSLLEHLRRKHSSVLAEAQETRDIEKATKEKMVNIFNPMYTMFL